MHLDCCWKVGGRGECKKGSGEAGEDAQEPTKKPGKVSRKKGTQEPAAKTQQTNLKGGQ